MNPKLRRRLVGNGADRRYNATEVPIDGDWRGSEYLIIDLETTGLQSRRDEIIAYGAVPVVGGRILLSEAMSGYVRPHCAVSADATRIHALRTKDVEAAPPLVHGIDELLPAMTGRVIVAHCAWIERCFLSRALRSCTAAVFHNPIVDTDVVSRYWPGADSASVADGHHIALEHLAQLLGLPVHAPHDALGDALTTAQVFLALAKHLERTTPSPLSARMLTDLSAPTR